MEPMTALDWIGFVAVLVIGTVIFRQYFWYGLGIIMAAFTVIALIGVENIVPALAVLLVCFVLIGSLVMAYQHGQEKQASNSVTESAPYSAAEIARIHRENAQRNAARNPPVIRTAPVSRPKPTGKYGK